MPGNLPAFFPAFSLERDFTLAMAEPQSDHPYLRKKKHLRGRYFTN